MTLMKFKLLAGFHIAADKSKPKISYMPNVPEEQKIYPDRRYKQGDVIETDEDLGALFNQPGTPPKFERVDGYGAPEGWGPIDKPKDGLDELTVKALKELAEAYEVDLKGATTKDSIVSILRGYEIKPELVEA